jgi:hypothetical protein
MKTKKKVTFDEAREARNARKKQENIVKVGPPSKQSEVVQKVVQDNRKDTVEKPAERTREEILKRKALPYVDVPPLKATLRMPATDPVTHSDTIDQTTKTGPAYKSRAPVEIGLDIEELVKTVLDMEISVPLKNLAGVSGAIQKEIRKQVTKSRVPTQHDDEAKVNLLVEEEKPMVQIGTLPVAAYMIMTDISDEIPEGHLIASDPVLQYLAENKDVNPEDLLLSRTDGALIVGKRSEDLRAIYATINRVGQEECLHDDGSQIVSMGKETAVQMGLTWDNTLRISMESASNHIERTLGIARDVRFSVGGLDLFLQVHILENPPYKVLLGRPFDTLTRCISKTESDGSSELILTDPNTRAVATVPTYARGVGPEELQKQRYQGF